MRLLETEVLILGSGLAGLRAAIESAKHGVKTIVVSKSSAGMGSNSILAGGGLSFAIEEIDIENLIKETLYLGKDLNDRKLLNELARAGGKELEFLRELGLDLIHRPPLGYSVNREQYTGKILGGRILINKLIQEASKYDRIQFISHFFVYKILHQEEGVSGVIGFDQEGRPCSIFSKSVVLGLNSAYLSLAMNFTQPESNRTCLLDSTLNALPRYPN